MKEKILAKRYADALIESTRKAPGIDKIVDELRRLKIILGENPQVIDFLANPGIGINDKNDSLDEIFKDDFSPALRGLLKLLLEHGRIKSIANICDYVRATYSHNGAVEGTLKAARPLSEEVIERIRGKLESRFAKKIKLSFQLDDKLLGGIYLRIGNTVIDGSLRRQLDELKRKLKLTQVN